jgi:molybdenum cofactor synthesis domain-containing protein
MHDRSAALVVIGNEILSGKVQDSNAYFTARELRSLGVELKRIAVVPDELTAIAEEVAYCSRHFDFVITSGGVGPTHDDITMEGVAIAFKRELIQHPELARIIQQYMGERANAASLRMAEVPEGAVLNDAGDIRFPTVQVENVYVLPGIPQLFEGKLNALKPRLRADPYFMRTIYTNSVESSLAEHLNATLSIYPQLMLGSYPKIGHPEYRVKLTLESKDPEYLERAFRYLLELIPGDAVVKVE